MEALNVVSKATDSAGASEISEQSSQVEEPERDIADPVDVTLEWDKKVKNDEMQCEEEVSLDGLSIDDKPKEGKPPKIKFAKQHLKQHNARKKLSLSSESNDTATIRRLTPKVDCPEKIVLCIDLSTELEDVTFRLGDGTKYSGLYMAKRVMEIFVHTKHRIDKQHEFALVILNETAVLLRNFTPDPKEICNVLEDLNETAKLCKSCNLMSLFKNIFEKVELPEVSDPTVLPPPYLVRCILIYGRSNCVPTIDVENLMFKKLQASHYFFFDVLYIHQQPSEENKCQEVFQTLCDADENYTSYIFEVTRNPTKLHNYMAMLLAHPLQRPPQNEARYKIKEDEEKETGNLIQIDVSD